MALISKEKMIERREEYHGFFGELASPGRMPTALTTLPA
jgi:hypothetical protein